MAKKVAIALVFFAAISAGYACAQDQNDGQKRDPTVAVAPQKPSASENQSAAAKEPPAPHAAIEWSNWALVFVGLITFVVISVQARESSKATKAMRDSIRVQEVQYRQWVEVDSWRNQSRDKNPSGSEAELILGFDVKNTTSFPLTLKRLSVGRTGAMSSMTPGFTIPPTSSYAAVDVFEVSGGELALYREDKLVVVVSIEAEIRDILGRDCPPQKFSIAVTFGPNRCDAAVSPPYIHLRIKQIK